MNNNMENETPKYRKKRDSSTSKSQNKSKHKHNYVECLFICKDKPYRGYYCSICGKIGNVYWGETHETELGKYVSMTYDEIFEKYKHLEKVPIDDIFQKFLPITTMTN